MDELCDGKGGLEAVGDVELASANDESLGILLRNKWRVS